MAPGDLIDCEVEKGHWEDAMHALKLLHKWLVDALPAVHQARVAAVFAGVEGLLLGRCLWLSEVGRHVSGTVDERHKIKRIDRLLGNRHLHAERQAVYRWLARLLVGSCRHPCIIVDWSDVDAAKTLYLLRAAVCVGGRALPVYEEVHQRYHHVRDTRAFLAHLAEVLPDGCRPIVVTDAGFRRPWFEVIEARGWYYVGRVRNRDYARFPEDAEWFPAKTLYAQANARPRALGALWLPRSAPFLTRAYLYRKAPKGRTRRTCDGRRRVGHGSRKHARREREPWLLVSNLPSTRHAAKRVVAIYRDRMSIEEAFRDLKAYRHGFAFRSNRGRDPRRVANLLLLAALAMLALWLIGLAGIQRGLDRNLQANTERRRRVLSVLFIGKRLFYQRIRLRRGELVEALAQMSRVIRVHDLDSA